MFRILLTLVLLSLPAVAQAGEYDIPAFPGAPAPALPSSSYSQDTPIQTLAADHGAAAVIERNIPGLLTNAAYPTFKCLSLRTVAAMSSGRISRATLSQIDRELSAVSQRVAKK